MRPLFQFFGLLTPRERVRAIALLAGMLGGALLETAGVGIVVPFLVLLSDPAHAHTHTSLRILAGLLRPETPRGLLVAVGVLIVTFFLAKNIYLALLAWAQNRFVFRRQLRIGDALLRSYLDRPYEFFLEQNSSILLRNLNVDLAVAFRQVIFPLANVVVEVLVAASVLALMIVVAPVAALALLLVLGILGSGLYGAVRRRLGALGEAVLAGGRKMMQATSESFGSIKEIKALGLERYFEEAFDRHAREYVQAIEGAETLATIPRLGIEALAVSVLVVVALVSAATHPAGTFVPILGLFGVGAVRLMPSANRIVNALASARAARASFDAVCAGLRLDGERPFAPQGSAAPLNFKQIELEHVRYRYPGAPADSLGGISLTIRRGERVALVGASGAGKTTLADVILGVIRPVSGSVRIDGRELAACAPSWRRTIGYVPQAVYLTDDSLLRNVAFAIRSEEISEERVRAALRMARLEDVVATLPQGLRTSLGENGVRLSGGQRQRVGIARALYHDPSLIVLDEATSALDAPTESEIRAALHALDRTKSVLVIAHRLSTVRACDRIFFLREGRVVAEGTFDALIAGSPEFRDFSRSENAAFGR